MLYRIFLFCCFLTACLAAEEDEEMLPSAPDQIATLTSSDSFLVGGLVSPLSGQLCLKKTDLVAKGVQDITLTRTYIPPYTPVVEKDPQWDEYALWKHQLTHYRGWVFLQHVYLDFLSGDDPIVRLRDPSGAVLDFRLSGLAKECKASLAQEPYGISNAQGEMPSGKYDPRNTQISVQGSQILVQAPDGTKRFYQRMKKTASGYQYYLEKEVLPNKKVIKYHYDDKGLPLLISSTDPQERYVYASIKIEKVDKPSQRIWHFLSSSGQIAAYQYNIWQKEGKLKDHKRQTEFQMTSKPILGYVSSPFYRHETLSYSSRFLLEEHESALFPYRCHYSLVKNLTTAHDRIDTLFLPSGPHGGMHPVYQLSYQPPVAGEREGKTTVQNIDGSQTIYHFSKDLLVKSIEFYAEDGQLKKQKHFLFDEHQWLHLIEVLDGQGRLLYRKQYEYDSFGNPIVEAFSGDLTGEGRLETSFITREFSQDGLNLLLKEEDDNGKITLFRYLPGTNLVAMKLIKSAKGIIKREFFIYDDCLNLIRQIVDDGHSENPDDLTNVKQRHITVTIRRQSAPFLHMPEWIEERYLEDGQEKLLSRKHLHYDAYGHIHQEDIYDAEGKFAYSLFKEYNERGDLLFETNPLGQKTKHTYDDKGRCLSSFSFSNQLQTNRRYDAKGRLIEKQDAAPEGCVHQEQYEYDLNDHLIKEVDTFGNTTAYLYDPLTHQAVCKESPPIFYPGAIVPVKETAVYDALGRPIAKTDASGNATLYRYNAYGSITEITYPDGLKEFFRYTTDGHLSRHVHRNGLVIDYTLDIFGRVIAKSYSFNQEEIAKETFHYNIFHLIQEINKEGHKTSYQYDKAGRKTLEQCEDKTLLFSYDSLGRLTSIYRPNLTHTLVTHFKRDLLDRIIEKNKTDEKGQILYKIQYSYDKEGHLTDITRFIDGKECREEFTYDGFGRLIEKKDALGHSTKISYQEDAVNLIGQKVLQTITLYPKQAVTVKTYDPYGRKVKQETFYAGRLLSAFDKIYDPCGNLLVHSDRLYQDGLCQSTQTILYHYTPLHQVKSLTRAWGTPLERTTHFSYTADGQIEAELQPNSIAILYGYHPLGYLTSLCSSDGKLSFVFKKNRLGQLTEAIDPIQKVSIKRTLDPFGNILKESFSTGLYIEKMYDLFDRPLMVKFSNKGKICYTYNPLKMTSVSRLSPTGKILYTHDYLNYDLDGNLKTERLMENLGQVSHERNANGQQTALVSPYFEEKCRYDEEGNLIEADIDQASHHYAYNSLSQLTLEESPEGRHSYDYDSNDNRIKKDGCSLHLNDLNELLSCQEAQCRYDLNGNLIFKKTASQELSFVYDPLNRLTQVYDQKDKSEMVYDPLGRRISKICYTMTQNGWKETEREDYLYDEDLEIAAFTPKKEIKQLRILGLEKWPKVPSTIAIEFGKWTLAPIIDSQGNIRCLVDPMTKRIVESYHFTAFGEPLKSSLNSKIFNPWRYASKRLDPEFQLIYFGKRYYDPQLGRWLTTDPARFIDGTNLYAYLKNNPFRYVDPDGRNILAIPLVIPIFQFTFGALGATFALPTAAVIGGALVSYGVYQLAIHADQWMNPVVNTNQDEQQLQEEKVPEQKKGKKRGKDNAIKGEPPRHPITADYLPDPLAEGPHTTIGIKDGTHELYTQGATFDGEGNFQGRTDVTDHGRKDHPNPHYHPATGTNSADSLPQPIPRI